jgi:hypothetical protein
VLWKNKAGKGPRASGSWGKAVLYKVAFDQGPYLGKGRYYGNLGPAAAAKALKWA